MNKIRLSFLFTFVCATGLLAQGPIKTSLNINFQASAKVDMSAIASGTLDTLNLPFFDDFAYNGPNPIDSLWLDDDVFVNNTFSKDQITRGIATFDHLDASGNPYDFLSRFAASRSDSLTSQCIDLEKDESNNAYTLSDSIYLSFYVQSGGLGDVPEEGDSLMLQFKDKNGNWKVVWSISGNSASLFTPYFVGILNTDYLFNAFQFRFINYVKNSGNMNHYHLDYVQMKDERSVTEVREKAIAFTIQPKPLLAPYSVLPYSHFLVNPTAYMSTASSREFYMRNNSQQATSVVLFEVEAKDQLGTTKYTFSSTNASNIPQESTIAKTINNFALNGLVGKTPSIITKYNFENNTTNSEDKDEQTTYESRANNSIETVTQFQQFYAYDDGSAEVGYALDYSGLPNGPGYTVMGFDLAKRDTLQGVDIHFNRALDEVGNRPIRLQFWKEIANGTGKTDQLIYEIETVPTYVNGRNGFARFTLDTLIILDPGTFYVGWQQNSDFKINVGWDENYDQLNTNIYYNLIGTWSPLPSGFNGTLMLRPLIGQPSDFTSVQKTKPELAFNLYPNPSEGKLNINSETLVSYQIFDLNGKLILAEDKAKSKHHIELLEKGIYICLVTSENKQVTSTKKVIIR